MQSENLKKLGKFLREKREAKKFGLREVARWADISHGTLSGIELGESKSISKSIPKHLTLLKIADALGLNEYDRAIMNMLELNCITDKINADANNISDIMAYIVSDEHIWKTVCYMRELQVSKTECTKIISDLIKNRIKEQDIRRQ